MVAKPGPPPVDPGLYRSQGAPGDLGDLLIIESLDIAENDRHTLVRRESSQSPLDLLPQFPAHGEILRGGLVGFELKRDAVYGSSGATAK